MSSTWDSDCQVPTHYADNESTSAQEQSSLVDTPRDNSNSSLQSGSAGQTGTMQALRECTACGDKEGLDSFIELHCNHSYCPECLHRMVSTALRDRMLFPPRCCRQPVLISMIRGVVHEGLLDGYRAKLIEREAADCTYCHERACSTFFPPETIGEVAECPHCGAQTCVTCKGPAHKGYCPEEQGLEETVAALNDDWQRCLACWRIVVKAEGCNHIVFVHASSLATIDD